MGSNKITKVETNVEDVKLPKEKLAEKVAGALEAAQDEVKAETARPKRNKNRSRKYVKARSQVDKTIAYAAPQAVGLVKKLSRKNHKTITADFNVREDNINFEIKLPFSTGKSIKVAIVDDTVLADIAEGKIDFDVLLAKPDMMAKIARHAKVLGPRGLMPNPKNNTVIADPEKRKKELEAGATRVKTEKKSPLIHVQVGTVEQADEEIIENLKALVKKIGTTKIEKLTLSSTMSPGVKVDLNSLRSE